MTAPLIIISGPSGSGKTTLAGKLLADWPELHFIATYTTRTIRPGETHGKDYVFVSQPAFDELNAAHAFLETNHYTSTWYGTPRSTLHKLSRNIPCIVVPDVNGGIAIAPQVKNVITIWIDAPDELRMQRLHKRGESAEKLRARIEIGQKERRLAEQSGVYSGVIENIDLDAAYNQLKALITT